MRPQCLHWEVRTFRVVHHVGMSMDRPAIQQWTAQSCPLSSVWLEYVRRRATRPDDVPWFLGVAVRHLVPPRAWLIPSVPSREGEHRHRWHFRLCIHQESGQLGMGEVIANQRHKGHRSIGHQGPGLTFGGVIERCNLGIDPAIRSDPIQRQSPRGQPV